ncbi:MAG: lectin like domain-containing protein [Ruminococcus sp.]|nr:lectin like domain-containing protein [Ruminococcus sp.]
MKYMLRKKIVSGLVAAVFLLSSLPVLAFGNDEDSVKESPLAEYYDESLLNPEYVEWLENGEEGEMPEYQDYSYLAESYAQYEATDTGIRKSSGTVTSFDLRDSGVIGDVRDQGDLSICWAVAAVSAAASTLTANVLLSPLHTVYFTYTGDEEYECYGVSNVYTYGGNSARAVGTLAAWKGAVLDETAPLSDGTNTSALSESLRYTADYHLQDAYYMPHGIYSYSSVDMSATEDVIKEIVMNTGAVTLSYCATDENNTYNSSTYAWYNYSSSAVADHDVIIVGWDDNYSRTNFLSSHRPSSNGAWLVQNSWGTDWGDDGYFWLSYEDTSIEYGNAFVLESGDNYTTNYQYDTTGWSFSISTVANWSNTTENDSLTTTAANIFTAEGDELLEAVSFYTTEADASYKISIYTGVTEGEPQSGTLALSGQAGSEAYAGYHTIELDEAVELSEGENFSIVVEITNPSFTAPLAIEWYRMTTDDDVPDYLGDGGESYIYTTNNGRDWEWEDLAGSLGNGFYATNACIKGFTNPVEDPTTDSSETTDDSSEVTEDPTEDTSEDPTEATTEETDFLMGDMNDDGKVTTADVGIANSIAKGIKESSDFYLLRGDMNGDGKISTADVGLINKIAKGVA